MYFLKTVTVWSEPTSPNWTESFLASLVAYTSMLSKFYCGYPDFNFFQDHVEFVFLTGGCSDDLHSPFFEFSDRSSLLVVFSESTNSTRFLIHIR